MEIKVGQWYRHGKGIIEQEKKEKWEVAKNKKYLIKVADTPQELIQVGDLVKLLNDFFGQEYVVVRKHFNLHDEVCKIYTPNKDKSQYTLQWHNE